MTAGAVFPQLRRLFVLPSFLLPPPFSPLARCFHLSALKFVFVTLPACLSVFNTGFRLPIFGPRVPFRLSASCSYSIGLPDSTSSSGFSSARPLAARSAWFPRPLSGFWSPVARLGLLMVRFRPHDPFRDGPVPPSLPFHALPS